MITQKNFFELYNAEHRIPQQKHLQNIKAKRDNVRIYVDIYSIDR